MDRSTFVLVANRIRTGVTIVVALVMVYALFVSREHITHVAHWIGVPGWQADTAFILVDLPALVGKVLQLKYFANSTRKVGSRLTYFSGALSLAANVGSGIILGSYGAAGWGAFVVLMFLVLESVITKIKPAAAVTRAKNTMAGVAEEPKPAKSGKGSTKGQPWSAERRARFEAKKLQELEDSFAGPSAPVSGV